MVFVGGKLFCNEWNIIVGEMDNVCEVEFVVFVVFVFDLYVVVY